ncbi:MAG: ABC transporter, partial [Treponema sp.]|nr:ABC transporter [Treponema sp.]
MKSGEAWLVIGPNGGGKAEFIKGLEGQLEISPNELTVEQLSSGQTALYSSAFSQKGSIAIVSLEKAASLIEEERQRDESEIMDKEDEGRTGRQYICEVLGGSSKKGAPLP